MTAAEAVLHDALALPPKDRAELASRLLESLDEVREPGAEDLWAAEITRRVEEVRNGTVIPISAEESVRRAYAHLAARRG